MEPLSFWQKMGLLLAFVALVGASSKLGQFVYLMTHRDPAPECYCPPSVVSCPSAKEPPESVPVNRSIEP